MKKRRKVWMYCPPRPPKPKVPEPVKAEVAAKAAELLNAHLKPTYIEPPPKNPRFNYIVDITTKWHRNYFYFCTTRACPFPDALSPFFETRFARMEYLGESGQFDLAYMRHTGQWWVIYRGLSLDECLAAIKNEMHFQP
jgi:hypothetical protein